MKPYYEQVYDVVLNIPQGRVTTYGRIATYLGLSNPRMVGYALKNLPMFSDVPAHRVVNSSGELSGRLNFSLPTEMEEKLISEGISVTNHRILRLDKYIWNPIH